MADQGYGMIVEERYRFEFSEEFYESARDRIRVEKYYISPTEQIAQLRKAGFESVRAFSPEGTEVTPEQLDKAAPWWIYYLATKAA